MNERLGPDELGEWRPLSVEQLSDLLHDAPFRWWIAGGWAIDLFLRRTTRPHADIEIGSGASPASADFGLDDRRADRNGA